MILTGTGDDLAEFRANRSSRRMPRTGTDHWEGNRLLINLLEIEVP